MTDALSLTHSATFANELYDFLRELDPSRWRASAVGTLRRRADHLQGQLGQLISAEPTSPSRNETLYSRLGELSHVLMEHVPDGTLPAKAARRQWRRFRSRLLPAYEGLARGLREEEIDVPSIRPTNVPRIVLHVACMVLVVVLLQLALPYGLLIVVAGLSAATCWTLETLRRTRPVMNARLMAFFARIAHPVEHHRVNSATWYATALFGLSLLDSPLIAGAAVAVLGVGDPMAGIVGRTWGKVTLVNRRTLEGSLTFVATAFLAVLVLGAVFHPAVEGGALCAIAASAAVAGGAAELFSKRLDDNFTVPVCSAAAATATAWLTGVL